MEGHESGKQMQNDATDLFGALSGFGGGCPEGVPVEFGLLTILAAFGVSFGILYRVLTLETGRRKRSASGVGEHETCDAVTINGFFGCHLERFMKEDDDSPLFHIADLLWHGE